ncbi:MAG TPA: lysylphosphatidylglycerol synthase transmembrane domain-containing protein [Candidatus Deferrimicrobium sp.]|nr:lysylphosphatidylglycerol synthase transmembrane domain-containing protein [Candidatus Deferrimicrobium sp.]
MKQKITRTVTILTGILLFAFFIYQIGPHQIWKNIKEISVLNFLILFFLRILYWVLRTINWKVILDEYEGKTSLIDLFNARMVGHAVSQLTLTAQVGSEATRIFMVNRSRRKVCIASVVLDKTIEFLAAIVFTIIGVIIIFYRIPLPGKVKTIFIGGVAICSLLLFFLFRKQKKGMLGWMVDLLARFKIRPRYFEKHREKIKETDEYISEFYRGHGWAFLKVFLLYSLLILLWTVEIHLNIIYIGDPNISFVDSFLITILGNLAFIFPFVPGSLGIYEATYIALFALLGRRADVGLALVVIRRILALLLAGFGLLGMIKMQTRSGR